MAFPKLRVPYVSRQTVDVFSGYNHNLRIGDGEFYDMKNLTSDDYPVLSARGQRGLYTVGNPNAPAALIAKDSLCYVDGEDFVINGYRVNMELSVSDKPKQLVSMGAYVIILPDKKWVNTLRATEDDDKKWGYIEAKYVLNGQMTFSICKQDGSGYDSLQKTEPDNPEDGELWLNDAVTPNVLQQWSASSKMWVQIATTYVKIAADRIDEYFELYDGIEISGLDGPLKVGKAEEHKVGELAELNGAAVVWEKGEGYIVVVGILANSWTVTSTDKCKITVSRKMPDLDFVIECGNRLWGCQYGTAANGEVVNEIYSSKLGDFKNWSCFMGISTDSWVGQVGTDGPFTGAISYLGQPLFFKENHLHKVYISTTAAHQLADTPCQGVQRGSERSLCLVGNTVFYKGRSGVCAYDGSLPVEISQALGTVRYENAVAGAIGSKYYISMADTEGNTHLFVYDAGKGMWHKEDNLRVDCFCSCRGELYAISGGRIVAMLGSEEPAAEPVEWMAQTGIIGLTTPDMKYVSRLILRLTLPQGSSLRVSAEYDSSGRWQQLFTIHGHGTQAFTLPVRPVRCDHIRLRLEGDGPMKLFSITKNIEQGSDVR
ncbi:MAG: hypothetical protein IKA47_12470 [Oscillospiraceae bacterium]|nr:hypothetical protein [Oscillospiraceae bacterium]